MGYCFTTGEPWPVVCVAFDQFVHDRTMNGGCRCNAVFVCGWNHTLSVCLVEMDIQLWDTLNLHVHVHVYGGVSSRKRCSRMGG